MLGSLTTPGRTVPRDCLLVFVYGAPAPREWCAVIGMAIQITARAD
jgi:hypothetical protein